MIRTQIYLPEEMHCQLAQLARFESTSISEIIRSRLAKSVKKSKITKKDFLVFLKELGRRHRQALNKLPKDFSARHTEYYLETITKNT